MIYFIIWCPHVKARISRYFESAAVFLICGCSYLLDDKSFRVKLLFSRLRKPKRSFHRFIDKFPNFIAILRARVHEAIRVESKTVNLEFIDRLPAKLKRNLLFIVPSSLLEEILNVCLNSANAQYNLCSRYRESERVKRAKTSARERGHYEATVIIKAMLRRLSFLLSMHVRVRVNRKKKTKCKA